MTYNLTNAEKAANLAKRFMQETPEFRRAFVKSRLWTYQLMPLSDTRGRVLDSYEMAYAFPREEVVGMEAAFLADIEAQEAVAGNREQIEKLGRRIENLEAEYADVLKRLSLLEDS